MTRLPPMLCLALLGALVAGSCAVGTGTTPPRPSMPVARAALRPEFRIFHDTLADHGDWVLIEPYGYLFRPRVDFLGWRPYAYGFWVPTDSYGWVWISSEPFGWATYHYGRWMYDGFQGWVWQPGLEWGPAWVSWRLNDRYVGWSPLTPDAGPAGGPIPGGRFVFTTLDKMTSTDLGTQLRNESDLGAEVANARPVDRTAEVEGVRISLGPPIAGIERVAGGPIPRVRIESLLPGAPAEQGPAGDKPRSVSVQPPSAQETRRAAEQVTREARAVAERGGRLPSRIAVVRPIRPAEPPAARPASPGARPVPAGRDTSRPGTGN